MRIKLHLVVILVALISLLVPIPACGGDDNDDETTSSMGPTTTSMQTTSTQTTTTSTSSDEPVKIGVLCAWSGSMAMAGLFLDQALEVANYYLEKEGGILGGRPVKWEKYDTGGDIARCQAGIRKLASDSDIVALTIGGVSAGELNAATIITSELRIPYFTQAQWKDVPEYPYAVRAGTVNNLKLTALCSEYALDNFDPKTVAFLAENTDDCHDIIGSAKLLLEDAGVETVYEQYVPYGTLDLNPYLTRIKAEEPDMLLHFFAGIATVQSMFRQIPWLGGWGDIEVISPSGAITFATMEEGAQGTYFWAYWLPGLPYPGAKKFEQAWVDVHGSLPNAIHVMLFTALWSAVEAIDQAGADRQAIADHIRSGTFGWEGPGGQLVFGTDGEPNIRGVVGLVKDEEAVLAP